MTYPSTIMFPKQLELTFSKNTQEIVPVNTTRECSTSQATKNGLKTLDVTGNLYTNILMSSQRHVTTAQTVDVLTA
jgi:hypothetical protein